MYSRIVVEALLKAQLDNLGATVTEIANVLNNEHPQYKRVTDSFLGAFIKMLEQEKKDLGSIMDELDRQVALLQLDQLEAKLDKFDHLLALLRLNQLKN